MLRILYDGFEQSHQSDKGEGKMICPECEISMESMGYGDEKCPKCNHIEYSESEEAFENRMNTTSKGKDK